MKKMRLLLPLLLLEAVMSQYIPKGAYKFSYQVEDGGTKFGHTENRSGPETIGEYHVLLPDGRLQTVSYTVDPYIGFNARVEYGEGQHPLYLPPEGRQESAHASSYHPAYVPAPVQPAYQPNRYENYYAKPAAIIPIEYSQPARLPSVAPSGLGAYLPEQPYSRPAPATSPVAYPVYKLTGHSQSYRPQHSNSIQPPVESTHINQPFYSHSSSSATKAGAPSAPTTSSASSPNDEKEFVFHNPFLGLKDDDHGHDKDEVDPDHEDPYLLSEDELEGKDFSGPFYYPYHRKILTNNRKIEPGSEEKKADGKGSHNHL